MASGNDSDSISISKRTLKIGAGVAAFVAICVILAITLGDGGGGSDGTQVVEGAELESGEEVVSTTTTGQVDEEQPGDCDELGINSEVGNEGTCFDSEVGSEFTVVDQVNPLAIPGLKIKLLGIEYTDRIDGGFESIEADEQFVICRLEVTNRTKTPQVFDESQEQVALATNDREFSQDFDAENGPAEDSFLWQGKEIQPGGSQVGTVIFDVPKASASKISKDGNLLVFPFGVDRYYGNPKVVGVIRTYK